MSGVLIPKMTTRTIKKGGGWDGCRGYGPTKYNHRGCFAEGAAIQNLPQLPFWVDPYPCPAIRNRYERTQKKRQREKALLSWMRGFSALASEPRKPDSCMAGKKLRRKATRIVRLLRAEQSLKPDLPVPNDFVCGSLRSKIRSMYTSCTLTLVQELSIKTAGMAESQPCSYCKNLHEEKIVKAYEKARYSEGGEVSGEHLEKFARAFAANIKEGWNRSAEQYPYVPNGNSTLGNSRREGGNWNTEDWSDQCKVVPIFTKGRWRVVTTYSSHNVAVLTPLHNALYASISRRNWLLVGSPTGERLRYLQSGCKGDLWLSFDYIGATDNIKTAYCQRAVEILINKGDGLTEDEMRCLRVVGALRCFGRDDVAFKGQPMGSPMSFPLLCLINKTIVDLSLTDLLIEGKIPFKEWTGHRCLINGDDLLTRSTSKGALEEAIFRNGSQVGMESNLEKTLKSPEYGEINSTVFKNCTLQKKTNVSALWMASEVTDVLGFARESCVTTKGFLAVVANNVSRLARQKIKTAVKLPWHLKEALVSCKKIKNALHSRPATEAPIDTNLFPVVAVPAGYDLSRGEENAAILERVREVREKGLFVGLHQEKKRNKAVRKAIAVVTPERRPRKGALATLKRKNQRQEELTLKILADRWELKEKESLLAGDRDVFEFRFTHHHGLNPFTADISRLYGLSSISALVELMKQFKDKRKVPVEPITPSPDRDQGAMISEWSLVDHDEEVVVCQ